MNWQTLSLPLIIVSVLVYHLSQKSIPRDANPIIAIALAYLIAIGAGIAVLMATGEIRKGSELFRAQSWIPIVLLGLSCIGIELGFLYAYRAGWKISTTGITTVPFVTVSLALIGVLWFKEELSTLNMIGIALCVIGVVCINVR